jgi:hypothetical protein
MISTLHPVGSVQQQRNLKFRVCCHRKQKQLSRNFHAELYLSILTRALYSHSSDYIYNNVTFLNVIQRILKPLEPQGLQSFICFMLMLLFFYHTYVRTNVKLFEQI